MKKSFCAVLAGCISLPVVLLSQQAPSAAPTAPANPITLSEKGLYGFISGAVIGAAQKMPEENYSFKPTPEVRSFGQLVGHAADANYYSRVKFWTTPRAQCGDSRGNVCKDYAAWVQAWTAIKG